MKAEGYVIVMQYGGKGMDKNDVRYVTYVEVLKEELVPAMGCTEPISLAFAAAKAAELLGCVPDKVVLEVSGNIIKNVKSVVVPNTNGKRGLEVAAAAGILAGKAEKELECIAEVTEEQKEAINKMAASGIFTVKVASSQLKFDIIVRLFAGEKSSVCRVAVNHTNIVYLEKNGEVLLDTGEPEEGKAYHTDRSLLTVNGIVEFADTADLADVKPLLDRQISYNMAIAEEGLKGDYGANVGSTLLASGDDVRKKAIAYAAAGSDARMNGCELPVVINSGSGNQGITGSVPVIVYARELGISEDRMYRALLVSNLITDHQKTKIGVLSAYCGAVSAGAGAACGIAYLLGADAKMISQILQNDIGTISGIICDGAKASCAAKIAAAVQMGFLAMDMAKGGNVLQGGDGICGSSIEDTISNVGRLASEGMYQTDQTVLSIMVD